MKLLNRFLLLQILFLPAFSRLNCDEVDFCNRIRNHPSEDKFQLNVDDFETISNNAVRTSLTNTATGKVLSLTLSAHQNDIFRLQVDDPEYHRHEVQDALDGDLDVVDVSVGRLEDDGYYVDAGQVRAVLRESPFRVEFYNEQEVFAVVNSKGWMVFEEEEPEVAIALDVSFPGAKIAYGLPEHADHVALRATSGGEPYRFFNIDNPAFELWSTQATYGTIPVFYAHSESRSSGIFWMNSAQTFVDVDYEEDGVDAFFYSESGIVDLFVLPGPGLKESVRQYASLTGVAPVPQYFALGYHQSRYSYESIEDVKFVVNSFDENNFPLDVIWLDIDYTDEKMYFTWNPDTYADPIDLQEFLNSTGRQLVTIIDPHIAAREDYFVYQACREKNFFVKNENGDDFIGDCWPGSSGWIDFFNPEARDYYSSLFSFDSFQGSTDIQFIWNDMNEPSVFGGPEGTMPGTNVHYGGWKHRDVHNQYGFYQTMGTYKGLFDRMNGNQRPFVLTRSSFAGSQRYTAMWTGDNVAAWDNLQVSFPMCLNQALGGMSFCGADIGGFINNPSEDLLQRWTQAATWLPFYRQHSETGSDRREPYLYPDNVKDVLRRAMELRYQHIPYWYTTFYEHNRFGDPVIRPLVYHYPKDESVFDLDQEWLVGENILVAPAVEENQQSVSFYLPGDGNSFWYDVENNLLYSGGNEYSRDVDITSNNYFYRGGSIVPRRDTIRSSLRYTLEDDINLYIFLDANQEAEGTLYVDDGKSFEYTRKVYSYLRLTFSEDTLSNNPIDEDAEYNGNIQFGDAYVYRPPSADKKYKRAQIFSESKGGHILKVAEESNYYRIQGINININEEFKIKLY